MKTINNLSSSDSLSLGDLLAFWSSNNGDTRKVSMDTLVEFIQAQGGDADISTTSTITGLKDIDPNTNTSNYIVLGGTILGDGLGGIYHYDGTSTLTDDDFLVVKSDVVGIDGRWLRMDMNDILVVDTVTDMNNLNVDALGATKSVFVKEDGFIYSYNGYSWVSGVRDVINTRLKINTIADLRALTSTYDTIWVSGYHTKDDGAFGSNFFRWNPLSVDDDNGGTVIKLDSVATGRYELQYDGAVNVKWFGIIPNNDSKGTENKAVIDNALASLGDDVLYFPEGVYVTDGYHNIVNKRIKGDGNSSIIQLSGTNTYDILFKNNPNSLSEAGTWGSGGSGIYLKDIKLKGNWDGASGQTTITPPSGNGNGIVGLRYVDYDIDTNKAVLQLISSTRVYMDNVAISHGYGHNMILYRGGYGYIKKCSFTATRGSGIYSPNPSASDTVTSMPIESCDFETCRGEYGGIYAKYWSGTSVTNSVFEGQPYGMYMDEVVDVVTTGNYGEAHYYEDFYVSPSTWGLVDLGNYAYGQTKPSSPYKGLFHYRRDSGFFVDTDNDTYGTRESQINGKYLQRYHTSHGGLQIITDNRHQLGDYFNRQLSSPGGTSLGWYSVLRHQHNANSLAGAAEIRFKRNLNQNSWSGLGFACGRGSLVEYLSIGDTGHTTPGTDNAQTLGSASNRWSTVYAGTGTINTSDDREKTYLTIDEKETLVAKELKGLMRKFKFNNSIEEKGEDNARIHFGTSAQTVKSTFEKYGLVAEDYALLCYDSWEEEKDEEGNVTQEAGDRYGIRYEELLCFIMSAI